MNIAAQIQFIPLHTQEAMPIIDSAIATIESSGLSYEVGPFGTSVEGPQHQIIKLVEDLLNSSEELEFLLNVQYHKGPQRLTNTEKVAKFR